jgi:2-oxo-4-hydroxy-4-carboxy--5-ureidoimidazoline (OHCU) decarboxylase
VRELPRQLSVDELAELFEGRTPLVDLLTELDDPLGQARRVATQDLTPAQKLDALNAHPAIGGKWLSARSAAEQGAEADPAVLAELERLNREYEQRHGFRFVVFVNRRPQAEILEVLRSRIGNPTQQELDTALGELVAIAQDRWRHG